MSAKGGPYQYDQATNFGSLAIISQRFHLGPICLGYRTSMLLSSNKHLVFILCMSVSALVPQSSGGTTFFVERDGGGDFTVIQHAVNAAASGDTIRIGPGRFDEQSWVTSPGWSDSVRVLVTQEELTIIGSGPETIIGQELPWESGQGAHKGIVASDWWGNFIVRIENIRFENMRDAIYTGYEFEDNCVLEVRGCTFSRNYDSLTLLGTNGTAEILDCTFDYLATNGTHLVAWGQDEMIISGCVFRMVDNIYGQGAVNLNGVNNSSVTSCEFYSGSVGVSSSFGSPLVINDCLFDGQGLVAVYPGDIVVATLERCTFRNQKYALQSPTWSNQITMTSSVVESVSDCSLFLSHTGNLSIQNCDLAKGDIGVVWVLDRAPCDHTGVLDMTNNYWGTDNPDSIRAWIWDSNDSEDACYSVDFEPFESESTPTEKQSLGGFRAMFRR